MTKDNNNKALVTIMPTKGAASKQGVLDLGIQKQTVHKITMFINNEQAK